MLLIPPQIAEHDSAPITLLKCGILASEELLTKEMLANYVEQYFKEKRTATGYIQKIISFLCSEKEFDLVRIPLVLQASCYYLSDRNVHDVHPSIIEDVKNKFFFNVILVSMLTVYLLKKSPDEKHIIDATPDNWILGNAGIELAFIQYYAFQLFAGKDAQSARANIHEYLSRCTPPLGNLPEELSKLDQNLLLTNLFEEKQGTLLFKSKHLIKYFAASYLSSCLKSEKEQPSHLHNRVSHGWDMTAICLDDYIKRLHAEKNEILKIIQNELYSTNVSNDLLNRFCKLINKIHIPVTLCRNLKDKIDNEMTNEMEFELQRLPDQIRILPKLKNIPEQVRIFTLIRLACNLKDIFKTLNITNIDFVEDTEFADLVIKSDDQAILNAVAEVFQIASGPKLSHYSSSHPFFSGHKVQHRTDATIKCSII